MHLTPNPKRTHPYDVSTACTDEALVHAYEQIARANENPSQPQHDAVPPPSDRQIPVDTFRPVARDRSALRGPTVLLLAAFICVAAIGSQLSYSGTGRLIITRWMPQLIPTSAQLLEKSGAPTQPSPATVHAVTTEPAPAQPATPDQTASQDVAPTTASVPSEFNRLVQTMARDLVNVEQGIEQLKSRLDQIASDNAQAVEQLKASQELMTRLITKASEQNLRPKILVPRPQPTTTLASKPLRALPSPQVTARPQAPSQPRPENP